MPYYRSNQYHSYNELNNDLLKYMSQEVISEKIKNKDDIYLEKDNNLYCWLLGGGDSAIYNPDKTEYDITKVTSNTIEVKVTSYMDSVDNSMKEYNTTRIDNIKLVKKDNNWIISKHQLIN